MYKSICEGKLKENIVQQKSCSQQDVNYWGQCQNLSELLPLEPTHYYHGCFAFLSFVLFLFRRCERFDRDTWAEKLSQFKT